MSRIVYTPKRRKTVKKSRVNYLYALGLVIVLLLSASSVFALRTPKWQVKNIEISGTEFLDAGDIRKKVEEYIGGNYMYFFPRSSFFLVNRGDIGAKLKKDFPKILTAELKKEFPGKLSVKISERTTFGIVCNDLEEREDSSCGYMDTTGFVFDRAPNSTGALIVKIKTDLPVIETGTQAIDARLAGNIAFISGEAKKAIGSKVILYEVSSKAPAEMTAHLDDGYRLILLREDNFKNVFSVLKNVLDGEIKARRAKLLYVDLRFGNKVFYKFK